MSNAVLEDDDLYANSEDGRSSPDDLDDVLSPADGYFGATSPRAGHLTLGPVDSRESQPESQGLVAGQMPRSANVPHVPNVMVEDPTLRQDAAETKAREAAAEASAANHRDAHAAPELVSGANRPLESGQHETADLASIAPTNDGPTQPNHHSQSAAHGAGGRQSAWVTPISYRNPYVDSPPAYTPAATNTHDTRNAMASANPPRSLSQTHQPNEQQPLLWEPPQSMIYPLPGSDMPSMSWSRPNRMTGWARRSMKAKCSLLALLTLFIVLAMAIGHVIGTKHENHQYIEEPVEPPHPPKDGDLQWTLPERCGTVIRERRSAGHSWAFNPDGPLTLIQLFQDDFAADEHPVHIFGDMILRPATSVFPSGYIAVESISNTDKLGFSLKLDPTANAIHVEVRRKVHHQDGYLDPCLQLRVALYVPSGARVQGLDIQAQQLNLTIEEGFVMEATEGVQLMTLAGNIISPERRPNQTTVPYRFDTPVVGVSSDQGAVRGWYPLYETLVLASSYEDVDVSVSQKMLKSGTSNPAALNVQTLSGNVNVKELAISPSKDGIFRDHTVEIKTQTGDVYAETLRSSSAQIRSASGTLNLSITPASGSDCRRWGYKICELVTETGNGHQHLLINPPASTPGGHPDEHQEAWSATNSSLFSIHRADSGTIFAKYPSSWQGSVIALTRSGNLSYSGEGLVMEPIDAIFTRLRGCKGNGDATMVLSTNSGDHNVVIGS